MQRAAYEALSAKRPIVASDSSVLRSALGSAARYAAPEATSIAAAVRDAESMRDRLIESGEQVAAAMAAEADSTLREIAELRRRR